MILLLGQNPIGNVLHIITGAESDAAMAVNGCVMLDITPALKQMDVAKPVVIKLTRCDSEAKFTQNMQSVMGTNGTYPFIPPIIAFGPQAMVDKLVPEIDASVTPDIPAAVTNTGVCSKCGDKRAVLVQGITPSICTDCVKIELGLKRSKASVKKEEAGHA